MRVLGLDFGEKRIGVAMGEAETGLAFPLTTIECTSGSAAVETILRLATENDVSTIVVGMPFTLSGKRGPQAREVSRFTESLRSRTVLPVETVDERHSTTEAERLLQHAGVEPSRDRARVDAAAATVILQTYFDSTAARDR